MLFCWITRPVPKDPNDDNEDFFWCSNKQLIEILITWGNQNSTGYEVEQVSIEENSGVNSIIEIRNYNYNPETKLEKKYIQAKLFLKNLTIKWIRRHLKYILQIKKPKTKKPTIDFMYWLEWYEQIKTKIFNVLWQNHITSLQKAQLDTAFMIALDVHWLTLRNNWEQYIKHILFIANALIEQSSSTKITSDPQQLVDYLTLIFLHDVWEDWINKYFYKLLYSKDTYWNYIISWGKKNKDLKKLLWDNFRLSSISFEDLEKIVEWFWNPTLIKSLSLLTKKETAELYKESIWWKELYGEYSSRNWDKLSKDRNIKDEKEYKTLSYYWNLVNWWNDLSQEHIMAIRVKLLDKYHNCISTRWWWEDPNKWYERTQEARLLLLLIEKTWNKKLFYREYKILEATVNNLHSYIWKESWSKKHRNHNKKYERFANAIANWDYIQS